MTLSISNRELISALADDQLHGKVLEETLDIFTADDLAMASWADVHLIGEVLRAPAVTAGQLPFHNASLSFLDRFNQALTTSSPQATDALVDLLPAVTNTGLVKPAANDSWFGWKLAAGFATLAAVSVTVWTLSAGQRDAPSGQLAQLFAPARVLVASPQGVVVRDARLNELLASHKQLGSGSALQAPSGFLQSAAFEITPASDR